MNNSPGGKNFQYDNTFFDKPKNYGIIKLFQAGEICCERGYEVYPHVQICDEVSYIISGEGWFYIDGVEVPVETGSLFINRKGTLHSIRANPNSMLRYVYIGFNFKESSEKPYYSKALDFIRSEKYHHKKVAKNQGDIFLRIIDELYNKNPYYEVMLANYAEQMLVTLYRIFNLQTIKPYKLEHTELAVGGSAYSVIRYVNDNIYTITSIRDIAVELGYSYTYLSHMFKNKTGMTLQQYINHIKIETAQELLKRDGYTITMVSEILNYNTLQSFNKSFKRHAGIAPSHYIKREKDKSG